MPSDPLLPDLPDVPQDKPAASDEADPGADPETPVTETDPEHRTGEERAQENKDRESPA